MEGGATLQLYVGFLLGVLALGIIALAGAVVAGYRWGRFAATKARSQDGAKWQAYLLALLPPAAFALTFLLDGTLSPFAAQAFTGLAAPAAVGTCLRYNRGEQALL